MWKRLVIFLFFSADLALGRSVGDLASSADAVVVGSVMTRVETPASISFDISVERVLKGSQGVAIYHVAQDWRSRVIGASGTISFGLHGMWFLTANADGTWHALSLRGPDIVTNLFFPASAEPPSGPLAYPASTPLVDAITFEVGNGSLTSLNPSVVIGAFESADGTMDSAAIRRVLNTFLASSDKNLQGLGLAGSLARQIPGIASQLGQLWHNISMAPSASLVVSAVRDRYRDPSPSSVQQLVSIAQDESAGSQMHAAAVRALASVHTKESLPFLAALLSSADPAEKMQGVFGISSFVNGCPIQTHSNVVSMDYLHCDAETAYKTNDTLANFAFRRGLQSEETKHIQFWQNWWNTHPELH